MENEQATNCAAIAGDILWALSGDPETSVVASEIVGAARRSARRNRLDPDEAARMAANRMVLRRREQARLRLASRPADALLASGRAAIQIRDLPVSERGAAALALAQHGLQAVLDARSNNGDPNAVLESLRDVADEIWSATSPESLVFDSSVSGEMEIEEYLSGDDDDGEYFSSVSVGWSPWGKIKKAVSKIGKGAKTVIRSKVLKMGVAGLAMAVPAVGVPAATALAVANKVVDAEESLNPKVRAKASTLVRATVSAAKGGDKDAMRALKVREIALRSRAKAQATASRNARANAALRANRAAQASGSSASRAAAASARAAAAAKGRARPAWKQQIVDALDKG